MFQVALPLLAVELTRSPSLVAAITFSLTLPWLLFALPVGALVDRQDCRRVMVAANLLRAAVLGVLTSAVLLGAVSLPVVFLAALLMGSLRSSPTLRRRPSCRPSCPTIGWKAPMPGSWAPRRSPTGHGPTTGWCADRHRDSLALGVGGTLYAVAAAGLAVLRGAFRPAVQGQRWLRSEIAEGIRFLVGHRLLRTLAFMVFVMNIGWGHDSR